MCQNYMGGVKSILIFRVVKRKTLPRNEILIRGRKRLRIVMKSAKKYWLWEAWNDEKIYN